jgi:hypothetical protein
VLYNALHWRQNGEAEISGGERVAMFALSFTAISYHECISQFTVAEYANHDAKFAMLENFINRRQLTNSLQMNATT